MSAEDHPTRAARVLGDILEHVAIFLGRGIANGVGHVDRGGARGDRGLDDLGQKIQLGARGVLRREFHVLHVAPGARHALHREPQYLILRFPKLEIAMDL